MQFTPLAAVRHRIRPGLPLPFNVRDADRTLLLARGHVVENAEQMTALVERGALVDVAELLTRQDVIRRATLEALPGLWQDCMHHVGAALMESPREHLAHALEEATEPVLALVERDADLAIFQVLRASASERAEQAVQHCVHTAITSFLVARRLGWDRASMERVLKVALTMNLSMLELHGVLAQREEPPTDEERGLLHTHPVKSMEMLQLAGITDRDWLGGVARHHEREDGKGYPTGSQDVGELAAVVRRADEYTTKLSRRAGRDSIMADQAGRQMFMQEPGNPMVAALVKEFGVYPPGCCVRLATGEMAVVIRRGPTVTTPIVSCLTNSRGVSLPWPIRRDTSVKGFAIVAVLGQHEPAVQLDAQRLKAILSS